MAKKKASSATPKAVKEEMTPKQVEFAKALKAAGKPRAGKKGKG